MRDGKIFGEDKKKLGECVTEFGQWVIIEDNHMGALSEFRFLKLFTGKGFSLSRRWCETLKCTPITFKITTS
jgi:hypothetical protein